MTEPTDDKPPGLSRVHRRLIEPDEQDGDLLFQHTVFCQTGLPYRNPGDDVREWQREQGAVSLRVEAGAARHPKTGKWVRIGLPWGTKPRLILAHLNAEALQQGSPTIEIERSLSAFVRRIRGFDGGREIRMFKDQLARLSVATVRLAMTRGGRAFQINTQIIAASESRADRASQESFQQLSRAVFESVIENLQKHAASLPGLESRADRAWHESFQQPPSVVFQSVIESLQKHTASLPEADFIPSAHTVGEEDRALQTNTPIVTGFELWPPADERQGALWPSTITLSAEYFRSLQNHAVPLRESDLAALAHSAMALDLYAWLTQRLHRVDPKRPAFVPWEALRQQFGPDYGRMNNFRAEFRVALKQVFARYPAARIELGKEGMALRHSPPPVAKRSSQVLLPD